MAKRVILALVLVAVIATTAAYRLRSPRGVPAGAPQEQQMAASLGRQIMTHIHRGHVPGRSGDVMLVPRPNNYVIGAWDLTSLGTDTPWLASSHPNPWAYETRIPLILYGHGYVPSGSSPYAPVDAADLSPTYGRLMGMKGFSSQGHPLPGIAAPSSRKGPPKAIVTVVLDGGGWNDLQQHVGAWPELARLAASGTSFPNATNGSAPSITAAIHATFGTGDYPRAHGIPGNQLRAPSGKIEDSWLLKDDPRFLGRPTLSDLWDAAHHNKAIVGEVAFDGWHLGMLGHGAQMPGGDKDIAVTWTEDPPGWTTNPGAYQLPRYVKGLPNSRLASYEGQLDGRDGVRDGTWFGHTLKNLRQPDVRPGTPAFVRFTGDAVNRVLRREPWGKDRITDLLWVEFKAPDFAGHIWNMVSPEEGDVLREVDSQIARIKTELDRKLGRGNYVLAVSADHGQQPLPDDLGGWRIDADELQKDIEARFGPVVEKITPVDVYLDPAALARSGYTADDIARYLGTYTLGENIPAGKAGADRVPSARLGQRLFAAALSARYIDSLSPATIRSFGPGAYKQGDLNSAHP